MKLELKHLSPYLPYNLKIGSCHSHGEYKIYSEMFINDQYGESNGITSLLKGKTNWGTEIKPILKPLSDLNDIESNIFSDKYYWFFSQEKGFMIKRLSDTYCLLLELNFLYENHFDVFGLIDKELAIDINKI